MRVLKHVDLQVNRGEIIGLIGDNGAGKTTLLSIIMGILRPDEGEIYFEGERVSLENPHEARNSGIEMVHQNMGDLIADFSIVDNFFLGREISKKLAFFNVLDRQKMNTIAIERTRDLGITLRSPNEKLSALSGGERQAIAQARASYFGSKLLLLDEPTSALSVKETEKVLASVRKARDESNVSIMFVSHLLHHVYSIADRVVALSKGQKIADLKKQDTTVEQMVGLIS